MSYVRASKPKGDKGLKVRMSIRDLDKPENSQKKNDFLKAWKLIKELPPTNPNSFWSIASYHGMPGKSRRVPPEDPVAAGLSKWWEGYCQHGNVLFPTWHRFYCLRIEQALQTVVPEGDVALHYWDETSDESLDEGLPQLLLQKCVTIDGHPTDNPLLGFEIPREIAPDGNPDDAPYAKPANYTTVRYPYSGIKNPADAKAVAESHNAYVDSLNKTPEELLQENVKYWLNIERARHPPPPNTNSILAEFEQCLEAPNYNAFSNITSSGDQTTAFQALEQPHNDVHLMIGGFTTPFVYDDGSVEEDERGNIKYAGLMLGSNGDMGENETASFDPIFFLHHCNIDRMFWVWQKKFKHTTQLTISSDDTSGGITPEAQGPTPNQEPDQTLGMDTILYPFVDELGVPRTSNDCVNVEDLGYTYSIGSLDKAEWPEPTAKEQSVVCLSGDCWTDVEQHLADTVKSRKPGLQITAFVNRTDISDASRDIPLFSGGDGFVHMGGVKWKQNHHLKVQIADKGSIKGSFVVQAFYRKDGKLYFIGQHGVQDRWVRENCSNCLVHRRANISMMINHAMGVIACEKDLEVHLVSKEPKTGALNTKKLKYEAAVKEGTDRFDIITSYQQQL